MFTIFEKIVRLNSERAKLIFTGMKNPKIVNFEDTEM
jgi:hypothetical protein